MNKSQALKFFADRPTQSPTEWCVENLVFDEEDNHGPFRIMGHEYNREPLDSFAAEDITDRILVYGSQLKKTGTLMGAAAWLCVNIGLHLFWVMPNSTLVKAFSRNRLMPMLRRSPGTRCLIPTGAQRHDFQSMSLKLGPSLIDFAGSNSAANLSSRPCRGVFQDEVEKFDTSGGNKEANASNLADQRTKDQACPIRAKTSTPTFIEGVIWQELLKTDFRRRFVPCPHCSKRVVLVHSKSWSALPKLDCLAEMRWDNEARRKDGTWDLDRVEKSARYVCPHCAGHILDRHKTLMDRNGEWRPTLPAARGRRGWHLPSFYGISPETSVGKLAVKFLNEKNSLLGLQGYINSECAEPYQGQENQGERIEIIRDSIQVTAEHVPLLTVDCQERAPYFWHVARQWNGGDSGLLSAGPLDSWDDVLAVQRAKNIQDRCTMPDSGFGAKSDAEVYRECAAHGEIKAQRDRLPLHVGWMPAKGMPGRTKWKNSKGLFLPWHLQPQDPFSGTAMAAKVEMMLFEFRGDFFKDILQALREGKGGRKWEVATDAMMWPNLAPEAAANEYWRHLDGEHKMATRNPRTGRVTYEWVRRSKYWPNHLFDCEVMQVALANFFELLSVE